MNTILNKQRRFFGACYTKSLEFRKEQLEKLRSAIEKNEDSFARALNSDLGKSPFESYMTEIGVVKDEINHILSNLKKWAAPEKAPSSPALFPSKAKIYKEPLGVSLIISPWNYPVQLTLSPLAASIAAGCCTMLKPSEFSPACSKAIKEMLRQVFDEEYVSVVTGGAETSAALLEEKFDVIFFTGGSRAGKTVMTAAAKNLTPVILELGGKSPCIADKTADIKTSAKRIAWGKFLNSGQTCVAPDYLLVQNEIKDELTEEIKACVKAFYGNSPLENEEYPKIITLAHLERLAVLLKSGDIVSGGKYDAEKLKMEPTILDNVSLDSKIMEEEIFGPILPVIGFGDMEEAAAIVNERPRPLALYLFTRSSEAKNFVLKKTSFGGGCINDTVVHLLPPELPFGGVGASGFGKYHGKAGFDAFSNRKSILERSFTADIPLRYPPYLGKMRYLKIFERVKRLFGHARFF